MNQSYLKMSKDELKLQYEKVLAEYNDIKAKGLNIDINRGCKSCSIDAWKIGIGGRNLATAVVGLDEKFTVYAFYEFVVIPLQAVLPLVIYVGVSNHLRQKFAIRIVALAVGGKVYAV